MPLGVSIGCYFTVIIKEANGRSCNRPQFDSVHGSGFVRFATVLTLAKRQMWFFSRSVRFWANRVLNLLEFGKEMVFTIDLITAPVQLHGGEVQVEYRHVDQDIQDRAPASFIKQRLQVTDWWTQRRADQLRREFESHARIFKLLLSGSKRWETCLNRMLLTFTMHC